MTDNSDVIAMETSSSENVNNIIDSDNDSFLLSGDDEFDSIVGTIDVNEATRTTCWQKSLATPDLKIFRRNQLIQFSTKKIGYSTNR